MSTIRPWRELDTELLLDCRVFDVERSRVLSPFDGSPHEFYRVRNADWVQIVPVTADDELVMIRQYRHGSQTTVLEIPGGIVDPGESPAVAAARECREETGFVADTLVPLTSLNPNPAIHTSALHSFIARNVVRVGEIQNTGTEQTEVVLMPVADLPGLLRSGGVDHALVVATLWRYLFDRNCGTSMPAESGR